MEELVAGRAATLEDWAKGVPEEIREDSLWRYEYALGSARESKEWYFKGRKVLGREVVAHRLNVLAQIIHLLLVMIPDQRGRVLREDEVGYHINTESVP
jgi:hypothetical protein